MSDTFHFVFLRHAESVGNAEGRFQGWADYPLSPRGLEQVQELAQKWVVEKREFDLCISSPLQRARQTAEVLAQALHLRIEFDPDWRELNNGRHAGLSQEELSAQGGLPPILTPYTHYGETGESRWELFLRAGRALQRLLDHPPGRYLIVAHGGSLNMALYAILNIPLQFQHSGPRFSFGNLGFAEIDYDPSRHRWKFKNFNPGYSE
ncbi:MAG: histidine phosphatase family protein [Anaerolineales bacterium]